MQSIPGSKTKYPLPVVSYLHEIQAGVRPIPKHSVSKALL